MKLIERILPLKDINQIARKEKSNSSAKKVSTICRYTGKKPESIAKAVIFASLINDPYKDETLSKQEKENKEKYLLNLIKQIANNKNSSILEIAKEEILKSTNYNPPTIYDPFLGIGSILLSAQYLNLNTIGNDINFSSFILAKTILEFNFFDTIPIHQNNRLSGAQGIIEDINYYANIINKELKKRISHLYQNINKNITYYIWSKIVDCPNCNVEVPLAINLVSNTKDIITAIIPYIIDKKVYFKIEKNPKQYINTYKLKNNKSTFFCLNCSTIFNSEYIIKQGEKKLIKEKILCIIKQEEKKNIIEIPDNIQQENLIISKINFKDKPLISRHQNKYGIYNFSNLFNNRQLKFLDTINDILQELIPTIQKEVNTIWKKKNPDKNSEQYIKTIINFLGISIPKIAHKNSKLNTYSLKDNRQCSSNMFPNAYQYIWDYMEIEPFNCNILLKTINQITTSIASIPYKSKPSTILLEDSNKITLPDKYLISTDPPYFDNVNYTEIIGLNSYFIENIFSHIYPQEYEKYQQIINEDVFSYRNNNKNSFQEKITNIFKNIKTMLHKDYPMSIYFGYKNITINSKKQIKSPGWEAFLSALKNSEITIIKTYPICTENITRNNSQKNYTFLSTSILFICKIIKKQKEIEKLEFQNILSKELKIYLQKLFSENFPPADLLQTILSFGFSIFNKYENIIENNKILNIQEIIQVIYDTYYKYYEDMLSSLEEKIQAEVQEYFNTNKTIDKHEIIQKFKEENIENKNILYLLYFIAETKRKNKDKVYINNIFLKKYYNDTNLKQETLL